MSGRFTIRCHEFRENPVRTYLGGQGMTWENIVVDVELADGEELFQVERADEYGGMDLLVPVLRVWVKVSLEPPRPLLPEPSVRRVTGGTS